MHWESFQVILDIDLCVLFSVTAFWIEVIWKTWLTFFLIFPLAVWQLVLLDQIWPSVSLDFEFKGFETRVGVYFNFDMLLVIWLL